MSKVGGALPSWYWPAGIPRRVPVPQQPLGRVLRQRFAKEGDKPAIVGEGEVIAYSDLLTRIVNVAGGIQGAPMKGPFALVDSDPIESVVMLLGAILAGRQIFLPGRTDSDETIEQRLNEAKVAAILTSDDASARSGLPLLWRSELSGTFNEAAAPKRAVEPVLMLSGARGTVTHSHFSLSAMAASLNAFIPRMREMAFVCRAQSLGSWERICGILLALGNGMPVIFSATDDSPRIPGIAKYAIVDREEADEIIARDQLPAYLADASYLFVSTGFFEPKWRRRFEVLCDRPIFPIWGSPETGPVIASHPTWLPPHGHGFPLVNVSLLPIDPGSGQVSIVPWEMLERAEMGVEALSAMLGYADPSRNPGVKVGTTLRTGQIVTMDHVGVVALQKEHAIGVG